MEIGYHASHEQFPPSRLLTVAARAEEAGFQAVLSSDHLAPWSRRQGESGLAWSWLGAVLATTSLPTGVVTAPGDRYHPVIVAQAIATLAEMFPGRLVPALGSGQALNEHVTGRPWPPKAARNRRLAECASVIRRLLAGEEVTHEGLVTTRAARVWSLPASPPPLFAAALSPATAHQVAAWADGLITVNAPDEDLAAVVRAFREGGGEGRPVHVQAHLSWAPSPADAEAQAMDQWRANALPPILNEELALPEQVDAAVEHVPLAALRSSVWIETDPHWYVDRLASYAALGIDRVYLHQVGRDQERFVDTFGERVLPLLQQREL
ncbi:TIGR03885 family FMN-dependent LLM class oxidoreductase [Nocardioides carbamazepini]|uniref:TIGR03885 family FMN-dependent LLM class oxidoreductase n=1 Tax=Nocardioides carbamazepini TaxID=2854259 RepID=UPI002149B840|nr:TIGR03885 family FMN-dependent LLM class oxidoreductase [Nocardioides carbamazepini]MCR1781592.1 TIGR03885 family FMN-dependent LLM class oxidoreductase [Nocardioides carbamazepini]